MKKLISLFLAAALLLTAPAAALAEQAPDYTDLVTDAFSYAFDDEWSTYDYHVPKINRDEAGIQAVNADIWAKYYEDELWGEYGALTALEQGYSSEPYSISYQWAVNGDLLSLVVASHFDADYNSYVIYNVSLSVGRRITDGELLDVLGISREDFAAQAGQVLADTFEEQCSFFPEDEFKAEQRAANNSAANAQAVKPYLDENGQLCVIGTVYALAGAGQYDQPLTVLGPEQIPAGTVSTAGLPAEAPEDDRLAYFLENCDTVRFTRQDIEGFDEQMCEYARNGVYARAGRKFLSPELQEYFSQFSWYDPTIEAADFSDNMLNSIQTANVALVLAYEQEHGY